MHILIATSVHPVMPEGFKEMGWQVDHRPGLPQGEFDRIAGGYNGLIVRSELTVGRELIENAEDLHFIGRAGSGLEIIDLQAAQECGVEVFSSPEGNRDAVAEHVLAMILAFYNKIREADRAVREEDWNREAFRGEEISGKAIGIIGFGNTGCALARRLQGFDPRLLAFDPYVEIDTDKWKLRQVDSLEELISDSEIVSLHVQLTSETTHMVDRKFLDLCGPSTLIVNSSRGGVLRLPELVDALEQRRIRGACLDVFPNEAPATFTRKEKELYKRLYALPQVILSPHVAGWSLQSKRGMTEVLYEKIRAKFG